MKRSDRQGLQQWVHSHDDPPHVTDVKRRAYLVALLVSLPGLLLILPYLWHRALYLNAILHAAVTLLALLGVLVVTRLPSLLPLAERVMGLALLVSSTAFVLSRLALGADLYSPAFAPVVLLFFSAGLLVATPVRVAPVAIALLLALSLLGDWWPHPPAHVVSTLMVESIEVATVALMLTLLLYRHWWRDAKRHGRDLERLAHTDELTALPNRRAVSEAFERLASGGVALLLIDLDDFKRINDRYGHPEGDRVLWHVGHVLADTLGARGTLGRWGGEEFLAVLPGHPLDAALRVAEELRLAVQTAVGGPEPLSVSVGVAVRQPGEDLAPVLRRADRAIYQAKAEGKNTVRAASLDEPQPC